MSVPQGRLGFVTVGGTAYPVYNWSMPSPRNIIPGMPVGNSFATNFAEGGRSTRFVASMMLRVKSTEELAMAFWNLWVSRTFSGGFDDTATATVVGANGAMKRTLTNAKAEAFVLTIAYGAPIGLQVVFLAPGVPTISSMTPTDYSSAVDNSAPLMFDAATFSGVTGPVYGAELRYGNNHLPDAQLNGTKYLTGWDAGAMSAALDLKMKDTGVAPYTDLSPVSIALAGGATRTFALTGLVDNTPLDPDGVSTGQVYQTHRGIAFGGVVSTVMTPPLVIT